MYKVSVQGGEYCCQAYTVCFESAVLLMTLLAVYCTVFLLAVIEPSIEKKLQKLDRCIL